MNDLSFLTPLGNHLWQSTVCVGIIWVLTIALKKNRAAVRYWLWFAASVKFLVPFSILVALGNRWGWRTIAPAVQAQWAFAVDNAVQPFSVPIAPASTVLPHTSIKLSPILIAIWVCGIGVGVLIWLRWWTRMRRVCNEASPLQLGLQIPVLSSAAQIEPGVFGIFRPVLLLPKDIESRLTRAQLNAIVTHEMVHVRRRDNLTAAIHVVMETVFWFFPVVWWLRARLVEERENACDEKVLRLGSEPRVYAEGILNVCKFYVESPAVCLAGVTGANLKLRIEAIMANRAGERLNRAKKFLLASAGIAALAGPLVIGIVNAPAISAQPRVTERPLAFDAVSIKSMRNSGESFRSEPGLRFLPGRVTSLPAGVSARQIITEAYGLTEYQVAGGPAWVGSDRFALQATTKAPVNENQIRLMLQTLLTERFNFVASHGSKEMQVYALMVRKGGPGPGRYQAQAGADGPAPQGFQKADAALEGHSGGRASAFTATTMELFARSLSELGGARPGSSLLGRPVVDRTGLQGPFNFRLAWNDDGDFVPALQDELGLRLESQKAPLDILVISRIEKPSAN